MTAVSERYRALLAAGELRPDADQSRAVAVLDELGTKLNDLPRKGSLIWRLMGQQPEPRWKILDQLEA